MSGQFPRDELRDELSGLLGGAHSVSAGEAIERSRARGPTPFLPPSRGTRRLSARHLVAGALVVAVAVVAAIMVIAPPPAPSPRQLLSTPSVAWRLAGYLDLSAWSSVSPVPGTGAPIGLDCPAVSTCYLATDAPQVGPTLVSSSDGGATWRDLNLPAGVASVASLSCVSISTCFVGVRLDTGATNRGLGTFEFLRTDDSGSCWSQLSIPVGVTHLGWLSCVDAEHCVSWATSGSNGSGPISLATADAGSTWRVTALAPGLVPEVVTCTTDTHCLVTGTLHRHGTGGSGAIFGTANGAKSWQSSALPSQLSGVQPISCAGSADCLAMAPTTGALGPDFPIRFPGTEVYPSASIATTDGGGSWLSTPSIGVAPVVLYSVDCVTSAVCYVGGIGQLGPDAGYSGYGILLVATDGARTWKEVPLPKEVGTLWGIGYLSCLPNGTCYALAAQAAPSSPTGSRLVVLSDAPPVQK